MKRKTLIHLLAAGLLATALLPGCKKDEETEVLPSLEGSLYFVMKPYLRAGDDVTLKPLGLTHPDGKGIGYAWLVTSIDATKRDTTKKENEDVSPDKHFTIAEDIAGLYSVTCTAFADGYYSSSSTRNFYVVDPLLGKSITGTGISEEDEHITSDAERAGEGDYYTVSTGGLTWMRNNLANTSCGAPYADCEVMSYPLGRFYTWEEARTACPEGWRLPTDSEWAALGDVSGDLMADAYIFDEKLWEYWPQVKITNSTGMGIIPAGYAVLSEHNQFSGLCDYAAFWTADSDPDDAGKALYRYINVNDPVVFTGSADKASFGASVRCVK